MSKNNRCGRLFESASKSTTLTSIPPIMIIIVTIVIIILSIIQAFSAVQNPFDNITEDDWEKFCAEKLIQYLIPFHVQANDSHYACQWRSRNTIFRSVVVSLCLINAIISLVVIFTQKFKGLWPIFYWTFWIGFVMMFVVFVLDCDGVNTGLNACWNNFKIFGGIQLVTFYDENLNEIPYDCLINPYVYTACLDLLASLMLFCAYKVSSYYIVDEVQRKASIAGSSTKSNKSKTENKKQKQSEQQTNVVVGNNNNNTGQKKDDSPDPFAQYQGGYEINDGPNTGDQNDNNNGDAYGGDNTMSAYDE